MVSTGIERRSLARTVHSSKDKAPYKTHQGAYVPVAPATGWYAQISAPGFMVGGGFYHAEAGPLGRLRTAIGDAKTGPAIEALVVELEERGFRRGGETLKTAPRGFAADHPRIGLLRHKSLNLRKEYGFAEFIHTPALLDQVREDWQALRPFIESVTKYLEG